jgi:hypothetical protein
MANLKIISEDASLSKLSPSRIDDNASWHFHEFENGTALTASGGETIPPSKNPIATNTGQE